MRIIKQGKTKDEVAKIKNIIKRFECKTCGCIFEADKTEYEAEEEYFYTTYYCKCPNCGDNAFELRGSKNEQD